MKDPLTLVGSAISVLIYVLVTLLFIIFSLWMILPTLFALPAIVFCECYDITDPFNCKHKWVQINLIPMVWSYNVFCNSFLTEQQEKVLTRRCGLPRGMRNPKNNKF